MMWGFPKIRGTILGVPTIRTIVFWGLYWGPTILGNYHVMVFLDMNVYVALLLGRVGVQVAGCSRAHRGYGLRFES